MNYLTSVKTINGETSGFYQYPIKYAATSAEATDDNTLYVLTGNNYGVIEPTLYFNAVDPLNPLNLPANTIRCKFSDGYTPTKGDTQTLVDADENIWDIYEQSNDWTNFFNNSKYYLLEVLGANTTNVTSMDYMFNNCDYLTTVPLFDTSNVKTMFYTFAECDSLTTVPLFDTSNVDRMEGMFRECSVLSSVPLFDTTNVTSMENMFADCTSLKYVPLFNTISVDNMNAAFRNCSNVESGALALYQQASTQAFPPRYHNSTFNNCGSNTQTGAAELAQIPSDWK